MIDPEKFPEGHTLGLYEIKRLIGTGAFADVYLARHRILEHDVALKVIRSAEAETWEQQGAKIMSRLHHPNIVNVHFADRIDGRLVIAMDYVPGRTLRERMQEKKLEPAEALDIASALAEALDYVHGLEMEGPARPAHLDLKPTNILITADGTVKITDFGMAQMLRVEDLAPGAQGGSPAYMAPEQFAGSPAQQSDLWAVGVLLYEMLLGQTPFRGRTLDDYRSAICERDPEFGADFASLPDPLQQIITRCLRREPGERYADAKELAAALAAVSLGSKEALCPKCGAALLPGSEICPDCTLAEQKSRQSPPPWQKERKPPAAAGGFGKTIAGAAVLAAIAGLAWGGYYLWTEVRPQRITRQAIQESARPDMPVGDKEAIVREAMDRLKKASDRAALDERLRRLKLAGSAWNRILELEKSPAGDYQERLQALQSFLDSWPEMAEAKAAREKLKVWQEESRAFREAIEFETQPEARMCAILARWQDFHARQKTGLRRALAWDKIQEWTRKIENYAGYAELTVKSATGLPPARSLLAGGGQPHPYFVVLQKGATLYRSRTLNDNPSPIWDEKVRVAVRPGNDLVFEIRDDTLVRYTLLLHQILTPFPVDGEFRLSNGTIEANLEIRREK